MEHALSILSWQYGIFIECKVFIYHSVECGCIALGTDYYFSSV